MMDGVMMIKFILYIWQLPQNLVGWCLSRGYKVKNTYTINNTNVVVYYTGNVFGAGVSLGQYILLDFKRYYGKNNSTAIKHEYGHSIQSKRFGPLYLFTVGIVSATRNIWDRLFHKNWDPRKRLQWYYSAWPENQADKLGGVTRV